MADIQTHSQKFQLVQSHSSGASGVIGQDEHPLSGESDLRVETNFTDSGVLTVQARIKGGTTWTSLGTLTAGGDTDTFDVSTYDFVRFNFTVAAGSSGSVVASGFFKAGTSGGSASNSFATIQTDAGTSPVADSSTDTLTLTSSDSSITVTGNSTTDTVDLVLAEPISQNGGFTDSERFGLNSSVGDIDAVAIGSSATATKESVVIGSGASSTTSRSQVSIGVNALASGFGAMAIGAGADATGSNSFSFGSNSSATSTYSLALGNGADATATYSIAFSDATASHNYSFAMGRGAATTKTYEMVIGAELHAIKDFSFGCNVTGAAAAYLGDQSFNFINAKTGQTNLSASNVYFKAPTGTGTGTGGHFLFQTAAAGASGTAQNSYTTQLEITDDGNIIMANLPTSSAGLPTGALWNNSGVINIA